MSTSTGRSHLERFSANQTVYVSKKGEGRSPAKTLHGAAYKGPGVYDTFDPDDETWPHYIRLPDGDVQWFSDEDVTAERPIKVPKFSSIEEAEAWLEKHQPE